MSARRRNQKRGGSRGGAGGGQSRAGRPRGGRSHGGHRHGGGKRRSRGDDSEPPPTHDPPPYQAPTPPPRPAELEPSDREFRGLNLFPFQVRAVDAIAEGHSVLVAAPTGSGKTLVADYAIETAFENGWRVVYTSPIKALSNQKYRDFRAQHGDQVGIMTGDVTINPDGDLLVMTTEVFRNTLFEAPERFDEFRFVVHDEIHYLDDDERGTVWEESIIHAPKQMRLVGLSATVPNVRELADWIQSVREEDVTVVEMRERPVPLDHRFWIPDLGAVTLDEAMKTLQGPYRDRSRMRVERTPERLLDWLADQKLLPVLVFCFSRRDCELHARANRRRRLLSESEEADMLDLFDDLATRYEVKIDETLDLLRGLAAGGIAYHHAGMLPVHKEIVERLFTSGLIRVLFATETFSVGVNMPARTVAFLGLRKFNGERVDFMRCRAYQQMAGRAGRQGIDDHGLVVSILNPRDDAPGSVRRVTTGNAEPVISKWDPDYSTILALYDRMGDRVLTSYQKSFAKFQRDRTGRGGRSDEERILSARLEILKRTGHIKDEALSPKGRFMSRVNGYEVFAGEFWGVGLLQREDAERLGVLLLGAIYESRPKHDWTRPRDKTLFHLRDEAAVLVERWRKVEWKSGLVDLTPEVNFGLTTALLAWMGGASLAELNEHCNLPAGDLVRNFRLLLQFCRQIHKALPDDDPGTRVKLDRVMSLIDRDEVDARRQMELGQDPVEDEDDPTD